jgi:DNA polymerase-3 subunit alpha (Gram-positive type)
MIYLIAKGLPPDKSFKIMESVRKGKVAKGKEDKWETEYVPLMKEHGVPDWYIGSCKKIKYMFPKAHAAAYVTNAVRIAWFKVHMPLAYYAAYFTIRAKAFDAEYMIYGKEKVKNKMKEIDMLGNSATPKDKDMADDLDLVLEMYERGYEFLPIDLYKSHSTKFRIEDGKLRPPFSSMAGFGPIAAESLYNAACQGEFECIDDLQGRAKIGKSAIELLNKFDVLKGMTQSNQMSLFV